MARLTFAHCLEYGMVQVPLNRRGQQEEKKVSRISRAFLLLLLLFLLSPLPAGPQEAVRFAGIHVIEHFPDEILFSVVAEGERDIVRLELSYRIAGSPYTRSRRPDFTPATRVETTFRLDAQAEFYAPGSEFHYYWTATDAADNVVDSPEQVFTYQDDRFDWHEVSTERVAVYWYEGGTSFGQAILDAASRALERLEKDAGVTAQRQIRIYLYANQDDFRAALGPNAREWIGGQVWPHLALVVACIAPEELQFESGRTIPHEISHVVLYQATHNPYAGPPTWLDEGLAVHNQEVPDEEYPLLVEEAAREGRLIPLRALSAPFPSDPDLAVLSYAESNSIVEFILDRYGPEGLSALVKVFATGETAEGGVQQALGISLEDLEAEWRKALPATERTPVPGSTQQPLGQQTRAEPVPFLVGLLASGACFFFIAIAAIVSATVLLVRRRHPPRPEEPPPPGGWG
jgi:hypothetical protein